MTPGTWTFCSRSRKTTSSACVFQTVKFVLADALPVITVGLAYRRAWRSVLRKTESSLSVSKAPASQSLTEPSLSFRLSATSRGHRLLRLSGCWRVTCWAARTGVSALRISSYFFSHTIKCWSRSPQSLSGRGGSQATASSTGRTSGHLQERLNCALKGVGIKFCRQEGQHSFVTPLFRTGEVLEEAGQRGSAEDFRDGSRMWVSHIPKKTEDEFSRRLALWGLFCYWSLPNLTRSNCFISSCMTWKTKTDIYQRTQQIPR